MISYVRRTSLPGYQPDGLTPPCPNPHPLAYPAVRSPTCSTTPLPPLGPNTLRHALSPSLLQWPASRRLLGSWCASYWRLAPSSLASSRSRCGVLWPYGQPRWPNTHIKLGKCLLDAFAAAHSALLLPLIPPAVAAVRRRFPRLRGPARAGIPPHRPLGRCRRPVVSEGANHVARVCPLACLFAHALVGLSVACLSASATSVVHSSAHCPLAHLPPERKPARMPACMHSNLLHTSLLRTQPNSPSPPEASSLAIWPCSQTDNQWHHVGSIASVSPSGQSLHIAPLPAADDSLPPPQCSRSCGAPCVSHAM